MKASRLPCLPLFWPTCQFVPQTSISTARYTVYKDHITLSDYEIHDGMVSG
jgi:hypothetical protein